MATRLRFASAVCCLAMVAFWLSCPAVATAQKKKGGAGAKKGNAGAKKSADAADKDAEEGSLPDVDFDVPEAPAAVAAPIVQDKDETREGRERLKEIEARARTLFRERDQVMDKRRPAATERDVLLGQCAQAQSLILEAEQNYKVLDDEAADIKQSQLPIAPAPQKALLMARLREIQANGAGLKLVKTAQTAEIAKRKPRIDALNIQIAPFDARLEKLGQELNEARKQWLDLRQPMEKYSRGEFELLRRVLDEWLLIDGLWPNAYAWAALCSHEMQEPDKAGDYLEKAQNIPPEQWTKSTAAQLAALAGLVTAKMPGQLQNAKKAIEKALRKVDKKTGWETYFLVGRFYVDRERELPKAKAYLEMTLKIRPNCLSAKLWLARLQTIATDDKVRDLKAGTKTLEYLWDHTGKRSWRLAFFLFEAFHRGGRSADANQMWETTMKLAPADKHEQLHVDRKKIMQVT